jgi:hypothetical protein
MNSLAISNLNFLKLLDTMIIVQFECVYNHCTHAIIRYSLCTSTITIVDDCIKKISIEDKFYLSIYFLFFPLL